MFLVARACLGDVLVVRLGTMTRTLPMLILGLCCATAAYAAEDIEYVAGHIAEVPMDNRFGKLPVWNASGSTPALSSRFLCTSV